MRLAAPSRVTLSAALLVTTGLLVACGSARKVADDRPLCQRCHGGTGGNAAPPTSVGGATATIDPKVGAHQAHVVAGRLRGPIACGECHVVPADMRAHETGIAAIAAGTASRVAFGPLADRGTPIAAWDPNTSKCANTYCHGATIGHGADNPAPTWNVVDAGHSQATCTTGSCHGNPPDPATTPHPDVSAIADGCSACHSQSVEADDVTIRVGADGSSTHIDGHLTIDAGACGGGGCTCCHAAPPSTGAHAAHVTTEPTTYGVASLTPVASASYDFGCGNCHSLDEADHMSRSVVLSPVGAPGGSLKERNAATASYDSVAGTCTGVYCHSSGQESPAYVTSPVWSPLATIGCGDCHGNPPNRSIDGADAPYANSHLGQFTFSGDRIATGHFGGLPAAMHEGSAHGGGIGAQFSGRSAAPITCQTCHFETTDANYSGASGFYYWNPDGTYDLAIGDPVRTAGAIVIDCTTCHTATPPAGRRVVPFFHVNGARDVYFDRRPSLAITGTLAVPPAPNTPTRPYWYSGAADWVATLLPGNMDGTTLSLDLQGAASYEYASRTCTNIACHLNRTSATWGEPLDPMATCLLCHDQN